MAMRLALVLVTAEYASGLRVQPHSSPNGPGGGKVTEFHDNNTLLSSDAIWDQMDGIIKESKQASNNLLGHAAEEFTHMIELLKTFRPCATCKTPRRYGEAHDGGYVFCDELMNGHVSAGYSLGINGYDGWGKDVSTKLGVPIYQFDCTNPKRPQCSGCNFTFYDYCITAANNRPANQNYKTINELMALNGHGQRGETSDLVMQLDVESYEWALMADPSTAGAMQEFSQVSIEMHGILGKSDCCADAPMETRLQAMQNLNKHFVVTHLHGNNYEGTQTHGNYSIPQVLEVLFTKRGLHTDIGTCESNPSYWPRDATNERHRAELPEPHLPAAAH